MKVLLFILFFISEDSTISVYRRGLNKIKIPEQPMKRYKNTPKRKILYTLPVSKIVMINDKKGILLK